MYFLQAENYDLYAREGGNLLCGYRCQICSQDSLYQALEHVHYFHKIIREIREGMAKNKNEIRFCKTDCPSRLFAGEDIVQFFVLQ